MATTYKIHPAIGIARVGNSPDEFFVGPELVGARPQPAGGFKDAQCRVKRQAARFHIFAHHDDGTVQEITDDDADITWTVRLVNKKAANSARGNSGSTAADLTIDPGPRNINGPNQVQRFDTGSIKFSGASAVTVPLGEMRSDDKNHLLVLGGSGKSATPTGANIVNFWKNPGWYDDVSDGSVTATIKLRADNSTPAVMGAWVLATPPKFAPHQDSVITLYDRVLDTMITAGLLPAPAATSYTNDVYPILQRARDIRWVITIPAGKMTWPDPVTTDALRTVIFSSLKNPAGSGDDMPQINRPSPNDDPGGPLTDRLTVTQYAHMQRWNDNNYANDWAGPPAPQAAITPDGLDRAALDACVGGSFYPGIEAGGLPQASVVDYPGLPADSRPIINASHYSEAFRLDPGSVSPGDITAGMALPWQADFNDCAQNWWPVPRPEQVTRQGAIDQDWVAGVVGSALEMITKWNQLGFVVKQGNQNVETARCNTSSITLLTPLLNFQDVPQGPMGMVRETALAITFEVISPASAVTLQYAPGGAPSNPQLTAFNTSVTVGPTTGSQIATARLWVIYSTSTVGSVLSPQTVTVQDSGATQSWTVTIIGNTVARKTAAAALVLDRSLSMSEDRGDGQTKHDSLQQSAGIFVDVMLEGDGIGVVSFNQTAQALQQVLQLGDGSLTDINRQNTKDILNGNGLDPNGSTSIGNGIQAGRGILNSAATPFDVKSLVVLTDGMENTPLYIADVAASIDEFTYAVGLGQPQNISVPALQTISGNNGGYLLVTGAIGADNRFLLEKYFLQILAGVSNAEIVLDPSGALVPGRVERVPFLLTDSDAGVDVILLTPNTKIVDFRLQTPNGLIIDPWLALNTPGMRYVLSNGVSYYRLALPVELLPNRFDGGGVWTALLSIGRPQVERPTGGDAIRASAFDAPAPARAAATAVIRNLPRQRRAAMLAAENVSVTAVPSAVADSLPYSLVVHTYSNLTLRASAEQSGFEPGAVINLHASLAESGIPLAAGNVWAETVRPDGSNLVTALTAAGGQFGGHFNTTIPGVYRIRVRAAGHTRRGEPFTREKTLTATVWRGGNQPAPSGPGIINHLCCRDARLCELIRCWLQRGGVIGPELEAKLHAAGLNLEALRKCLETFCAEKCNCDRQLS